MARFSDGPIPGFPLATSLRYLSFTNLMAIFLGIDDGGSKTRCLVGDEGCLLGVGEAGGSNVVRLGETVARANLRQAIAAACDAAGLLPSDIEHVCVGVAGASVREVNTAVREAVRELVPGEVEVVGDMVIALASAFADQPGVIVIAGTGSIAFGRNAQGQSARAGGWGYAVSDEGSGHWVGRHALSAVLRAHDEGRDTALTAAVLQAWNAGDLRDLVRAANAHPAPDFAQLFPVVLQSAKEGDELAASLLAQAGAELAALAKVVIQRLWARGVQMRVAMGGGVFQHSPQVRRVFLNAVRAEHPSAAVCFRVVDASEGALLLARRSSVHVHAPR